MAFKNWLGILMLVFVFLSVVLPTQVVSAGTEDITFEVLSADSEHVGSFVANRCRLGDYWMEAKSWASIPFWGSELIDTSGLASYGGDCTESYIKFSAKPGYTWKYYSGWFGKGYFLIKD